MLQANPQRQNQSNLPQDFNRKKLMKTAMFLTQQWLKLCILMLMLMFSATSHAVITGASLTVLTDGVASFLRVSLPKNLCLSNG
jgi:hypothetical protein